MTGGRLSNTKDSLAKFGNRNRKGINNLKAPSPNASKKDGIQTGTSNSAGENDDSKYVSSSNNDNRLDKSAGISESAASKSVSSQLENEQTSGQRKQRRAPSPNDADKGVSAQSRTRIGDGDQAGIHHSQRESIADSVSEQGQDPGTLSNRASTVGATNPPKPSPEGNARSINAQGTHSSQKIQAAHRSSVQTDIDVTNEIDQSTTTATRTVQSSSGSVVQDNSASTHTVTNQQNVQHTDQVNVHSTQISHGTVSGQETQQQVSVPTIKRRPSSYQIPSTVSMQKLKSKT